VKTQFDVVVFFRFASFTSGEGADMYHVLPSSLFHHTAPSPTARTASTVGSLIDAYVTSLKPVEEIRRELRGHRERFSTKVPRGIAAAARNNNPLYLSMDPSAGARSKAMADKKKRLAARARRIKRREGEKSASGMESIAKSMKRDQVKKMMQGSSAPRTSANKKVSSSAAGSPQSGRTQLSKKSNSAVEELKRLHRRDRQHMIRSAKKAVRVSQLLSWCPRVGKKLPTASIKPSTVDCVVRPGRDRRIRPTPVPIVLRRALVSLANDAVYLRKLYTDKLITSSSFTGSLPEFVLPVVGLTVNLVEVRRRHPIHRRRAKKSQRTTTGGSKPTLLSFTTLAEDVVILFETNTMLAGFSQGSFRPRRRQRSAAPLNDIVSSSTTSSGTGSGNVSHDGADRSGIVVRAKRHFPGSRGTRADFVHNLCWETTTSNAESLSHAHHFFEVKIGEERYVL
jgi:hypothetical protein